MLHSFSWPNNIPLHEYPTFCLSVHQLIDIWVVSIFGYDEDAAMNICDQVCMNMCFHSLGYIPRSGIAGSYVCSVFNFLRNCQTVFLSGCIIFQSHKRCERVPIFSTSSSTHLPVLLVLTILMSENWYHVVVLISIFLKGYKIP